MLWLGLAASALALGIAHASAAAAARRYMTDQRWEASVADEIAMLVDLGPAKTSPAGGGAAVRTRSPTETEFVVDGVGVRV